MDELSKRARVAGRRVGHMLRRINARVPAGLRTLLGALLILGGVFGFLPVLGFWMIPLGIMVIGLDIAALRKALRGKADN